CPKLDLPSPNIDASKSVAPCVDEYAAGMRHANVSRLDCTLSLRVFRSSFSSGALIFTALGLALRSEVFQAPRGKAPKYRSASLFASSRMKSPTMNKVALLGE